MFDDLMNRDYTRTYTCLEFAQEAWERITGNELQPLHDGHYKTIETPLSPCLVMMKNDHKSATHIGIFYKGRVLHLSLRGVQYIPLEMLKLSFRFVSFYK